MLKRFVPQKSLDEWRNQSICSFDMILLAISRSHAWNILLQFKFCNLSISSTDYSEISWNYPDWFAATEYWEWHSYYVKFSSISTSSYNKSFRYCGRTENVFMYTRILVSQINCMYLYIFLLLILIQTPFTTFHPLLWLIELINLRIIKIVDG